MSSKLLYIMLQVILSASLFSQTLTVTYKDISPNPFAGYSSPIAIGIMKFSGNEGLEVKFYDELKKIPGIHDKFMIFPYKVLQDQKDVLKLKTLGFNDRKTQKSLFDNLDIMFLISGEVVSNNELRLTILRSSDGVPVFEGEFKNSSGSSTLKDAVKVISENKRSEYKEGYEGMVLVEGGWFDMGSNDGLSDEKPIHRVYVNSFYIGKYEVTQKQWKEVMGNNPSHFSGCNDCPVENVSWNDIQDFLKKLNTQTGRKYRLPTEAEWEYAARGGNKSNGYKYSGSNNIADVAWYGTNSNNTIHNVGQKKPNELGIYDMSGSVWEWCSDLYDKEYYTKSLEKNPQGPTSGTSRVLRGGSWFDIDYICRTADRGWSKPRSFRHNYLGFRLSRDL